MIESPSELEGASRRALVTTAGYVAIALMGVAVPGISAVLWDNVITVSRNSYRLDQLERRMDQSEADRHQLNVRIDQNENNIYLLCRQSQTHLCRQDGPGHPQE